MKYNPQNPILKYHPELLEEYLDNPNDLKVLEYFLLLTNFKELLLE